MRRAQLLLALALLAGCGGTPTGVGTPTGAGAVTAATTSSGAGEAIATRSVPVEASVATIASPLRGTGTAAPGTATPISPVATTSSGAGDTPTNPTVPMATTSSGAGEAIATRSVPVEASVAAIASPLTATLPLITAGATPTATPTVVPTVAPSVAPTPGDGPTPRYTYQVLQTYPHDRGAYTQGLVYANGELYESTGLNGRSSVRRVELTTGRVLQQTDLSNEYFGEGLALVDGRLLQLTWRNQIGFVYDQTTLQQTGTFSYATEGWGLAYDGARLVRSDGSATLHFHDPQTLAELGQVQVTDAGQPVRALNELEIVGGEIWANIYTTDQIARIDPASGRVTGWIDLTGLLGPEDRQQPVDVLNGIAYDPATGRLFVTGKLWPKLFEIQVVARP